MLRRTALSCLVSLAFALPGPVAAEPVSPGRPISEFRPSQHGFPFVNSFSGSPLPGVFGNLGVDSALGAPNTFGLCGGMSFAAADFFLARTPVPTQTAPPRRGTPLFRFLQQRQLDSLGPRLTLAARFSLWMSAEDFGPGGVAAHTLPELLDIAEALSRAEPAILGLVLTRRAPGGGALWENHQVLARAAHRPTANQLTLSIYDPNYPGIDDAVIHSRLVIAGSIPSGGPIAVRFPVLGAISQRVVPGRRATPVRGIFRVPYAPATPPAIPPHRAHPATP